MLLRRLSMKLINLSCNKCGAPLEAPSSANFLTCSYCGSRLAVHSSGSAHYTEVLDQIDHKTTQILDRVDSLVGAATTPDQWETCEILFARKTDGWFKAECRFVADAIGVEGRYEAL